MCDNYFQKFPFHFYRISSADQTTAGRTSPRYSLLFNIHLYMIWHLVRNELSSFMMKHERNCIIAMIQKSISKFYKFVYFLKLDGQWIWWISNMNTYAIFGVHLLHCSASFVRHEFTLKDLIFSKDFFYNYDRPKCISLAELRLS